MRRRVLIIEDDAYVARAMERTLAAGGFRPALAEDVANALQHLEPPPHAFVLDYHLPDGTALDVLRACRQRRLAIPALVVTGTADSEAAFALGRAGCMSLMLKPIKAGELVQRVTELLAWRYPAVPVRLNEGLDTAKRALILDALRQTGWNRRRAAELLGVSRQSLQYHMRQLGKLMDG